MEADGLTVDGTANITVGSGDNLTLTKATGAYLVFHDGTQKRAGINSLNTVDGMAFTTGNNSERMRIDSDGNVGIGVTPLSFSDLMVNTATDRNIGIFDNAIGATIGGLTNAGASAALRIAGSPLIMTGGGGAGSEHMRIDSDGNVGIGVVPNDWSGSGSAIQLDGAGHLATANQYAYIGSNYYYDNAWKYTTSSKAAQYRQDSGSHQFLTAAEGTANATLAWSEAMRIDCIRQRVGG